MQSGLRTTLHSLRANGKRTAKGCLEWQGWRNDYGYGGVSYQNKKWKVHRLSWHLSKGAIPVGKCVLHKCDNPRCFEVKHLFLGTKKQNSRDMVLKGRHVNGSMLKKFCKRGHALSGDNLYVPPTSNVRQCRTCNRLRARRHMGWPEKVAAELPKQNLRRKSRWTKR